jgi:uncharacterized protein YfaS (alpha-2-macroglobulin family)
MRRFGLVLLLCLFSLLSVQAQASAELLVASFYPSDGSLVPTNSRIVVIFNRPVVPLSLSSDQADLPDPLQIEPAVAGRGEWVNTSIYQFTPEVAFAGGVTYTVAIPAGVLQAVDGSPLSAPFRASFNVQRPSIVSLSPQADEVNVSQRAQVIVRFSEPVDRTSAESLRVRAEGGSPVAGTLRWNEDSTELIFTPTERLALSTRYTVSFEQPVRAAGGGEVQTLGVPYTFTTVPLPSVLSTTPFDGQTGVSLEDFGSTLEIQFVSNMNEESIRRNLTIEPRPRVAGLDFFSPFRNAFFVSGLELAPRTRYTVTLGADAEDAEGNKLGTPFTFSFETGDAPPVMALRTPGRVGLYNAARDQQAFYVAYRNIESFTASVYRLNVEDFARSRDLNRFFSGVIDGAVFDSAGVLGESPLTVREFMSEAQPNEYRFQLINLAELTSCPGAPASRLRVGDAAQVILPDEPVRARAEPGGDVVELLYRGYTLRVIGGPVCRDGFVFWNVQLRGGVSAWVAEGSAEEYFIAPTALANDPTPPQNAADGRVEPGLYYVRVETPELAGVGWVDLSSQGHLMIVGTASLSMKLAVDEAVVWAVDLNTGEPLADVPITLYIRTDSEDQPTQAVSLNTLSARTNAQGVATFAIPRDQLMRSVYVAVIDTGEHFGLVTDRMSDGIEPYFFGLNTNFFQDYHRLYLYTDRPLYRPGQEVHFKGVARVQTDAAYTLPEARTATVVISDFSWNEVYRQSLLLNDFGTLEGTFTIPTDAEVGDYYLRMELPSPFKTYPDFVETMFSVAEFRTPEFTVSGQAAQSEVVQGEEAAVTFSAEYFFGGPVSGAEVSYTVAQRPYVFNYTGEGFYNFADYDYYSGMPYDDGFGSVVSDGTLTADDDGRAVVTVPTDLGDMSGGARLIVEANFRDESGQTISARVPVIVHASEAYAGIRAERYVYSAEEPASFNLIAVDWQSRPLAGQTLTVRVDRVEWRSVQELGPDGRTVFNSYPDYISVEPERSVVTGSDGQAVYSFRPNMSGMYRVVVSTRDAQGRQHTASEYFWVGGGSFSLRETNSKRIELIADKPDYLIGETAQILITSPFQGEVEALVTVERGRTLRYERVRFSGSLLYELPIEAEYSPNVFVSVVMVSPSANSEDRIADFRVGYVGLNVERTRREITLKVERTIDNRPAEFALPAQTVRYTITATDYLGRPVQAEISAQMVDEAILSLMPDPTTPILDHFFGPMAISVRTGTLLVYNGDAALQEILDRFKGGGGGGGGFLMGVAEVRDELLDTAYWNAILRTDANGVVSFDVKLPDNLTTWRLTLRALTRGEDGNLLVGEAVDTLRSTKPLIIRPVTPRFFVVGDRVTLGAVVNNNTDEALTVDVRINAAGVQLVDTAAETQTVRIAPRGRAEVSWEVIVTDARAVTAVFSAESAAFADATISPVSVDREGTLRVYRYEAPEFVGTAGALTAQGAVTEQVALPADVTRGRLDVAVETSLAAVALRAAEAVRANDSDCLECVISKLIVNLSAYQALTTADALTAEQRAVIDAQVADARARLLSSQLADGGWAWSGTAVSDRLMTAYALLGLRLIDEYDRSISRSVIEAAVTYLNRSALPIDRRLEVWELNRAAFELWVLARSGYPNAARTSNLYEQAARLDLYAKGLLAQTLMMANPQDPRAVNLVNQLASAARLSASGARWQEARRDFFNWNTDTRTSAIVLQTLVMAQADPTLLANGVRGLISARRADIWSTLQETAFALWALVDYARAAGELNPSFTFDVTLNDAPLLSGQVSAQTVTEPAAEQVEVSDLVGETNALTFNRGAGAGVLYYTVNLEANLPITAFEEYASGFFVSRRYVRPGTEEPVSSAAVGERVEVRLTVIAPDDQYFVIVEDYLPAGMEAINPRLETSAQTGTAPELNPLDPLARGWGWWLFDSIQFRTQKVVLSASYLPRGTYEFVYSMRATVPGVYNVIPATAREQYFPDIYGRSAGQTFTVTR